MGPGQRRAALLLIAVISVNASYTVLIPFVPDLEERVGANAAVIALMFALFAATKTLAQPVGGWWVDRWRANGVACISLLIATAGIVLTAYAGDSATLLAGRALWGVGEGLVSPALYAGMAALCKHYDISTSRMMGNFGSAAVAGFLLGPLIAGVATPLGLEALFLIGAAVTAATAFGLLTAIPAGAAPPSEEDTATAVPVADAPPATRWWIWVLVLGGLDMFTAFIYSALEPVLPLYLSSAQDSSARSAISVVFVAGLAASGLGMWLLGRFAERLRLVTMIQIGLGFMTAGLAGTAISAGALPVAAWFVVFMIGYAALFLSARRGIVELKSASANQGKAFGLFGFISDVGNIIGPIVGVVLYEITGRFSFVVLGALSGLLLAALVLAAGRAKGLLPSTRAESHAPEPVG
ncbi:MFS transporter [Umezawaea tangerina]|uniref:Putative MFS family arabinose efflux permease n=1 Tax=Umezawaea tangerina TaxID=84725 RepID=A0A2T0THR0_9PSEU|nr:MFS transporter [Umezawaea tangerina]PRY45237.1 putative MFS family arabinose efflux permease [Umezawaea tangerina]